MSLFLLVSFVFLDKKKDIEKFLKDGLTMEEQVGLSDLDTDIKRIFSKYTTGDGTLSPREVGKKKKVEILEAIEDQNSEIKAILDKSKYKTLHKIINLTSEYITPLKKKKIQYLISEQMVLHFEGSIESETIDFSSFESRMRKRALRIERNSVRRKEILKYIENRDSYVLPSKR